MRYGAASALRRAMRLKFKATKFKFYPATKIKFTRRAGEISYAAKDKILSAKIGAGSARDKI